MNAYVESLAYLLHDELCNDTPVCARAATHPEYYLDKALRIISRLEPEIGAANVYNAVKVVLEETT